jgi:hypothetical protein
MGAILLAGSGLTSSVSISRASSWPLAAFIDVRGQSRSDKCSLSLSRMKELVVYLVALA